ncbi:MAG: energy transducer TonB [Bacteroidetes bacterium]|nr:energy transducer TonB [Bacteroidota bacterium]
MNTSKIIVLAAILSIGTFIGCTSEQGKDLTDEEREELLENPSADNYASEVSEIPGENALRKDALEEETWPKGDINYRYVLPEEDAKAVVYSISETDRPPIFTQDCLNSENPVACSNKAIQRFVSQNIEYPEEALEQKQEGVKRVRFRILPDGSIGEKFEVESLEQECDGCAKSAISVVSKLEHWEPALKDGKAVAVEVTLPVVFKYQ